MIGHRLVGSSLLFTGDLAASREHFDQAIASYNPAEHRPLAMRFGQDPGVAILSFRSWALWMLGYPEAALADGDHALKDAREIGEAATLMYALFFIAFSHIFCGDYGAANAFNDELITLAEQKDTMGWKPLGRMNQGCVFSLTGKASNAVQVLTSGITGYRSTGGTVCCAVLFAEHGARPCGPRKIR